MENKFLTVIQENQIEDGNSLAERFANFMSNMATIEAEAKAIIVTNSSQKEEMKKARELRLKVKDIRVESEKVRKSLKEDSLKRGKVIDALANIVKETIAPIEEYLENQEKFAEREEEARIATRNATRLERFTIDGQMISDPSLYNYKEMTDEVFDALIAQLTQAHNDKIEATRKAEAERLEKERLEREEAERNKAELERLKKENEEREAREAEEKALREKAEAEKKAEAERIEKERLAKEKAEREEAQRKIDEANAIAEKARKELEAKEEAERKAKAEAEEAERQAKLAPEKDKLFAWAETIKSIESPEGLSVAGLNIVKEAETKLLAISQEIKEQIKNL